MDLAPLQPAIDEVSWVEERNGILFRLIPCREVYPVIEEDLRSRKGGSIARFSPRFLIRDLVKTFLRTTGLYKTPVNRVNDKVYGSDRR